MQSEALEDAGIIIGRQDRVQNGFAALAGVSQVRRQVNCPGMAVWEITSSSPGATLPGAEDVCEGNFWIIEGDS